MTLTCVQAKTGMFVWRVSIHTHSYICACVRVCVLAGTLS